MAQALACVIVELASLALCRFNPSPGDREAAERSLRSTAPLVMEARHRIRTAWADREQREAVRVRQQMAEILL